MKLTESTLKQIIKEELDIYAREETDALNESIMGRVKGFVGQFTGKNKEINLLINDLYNKTKAAAAVLPIQGFKYNYYAAFEGDQKFMPWQTIEKRMLHDPIEGDKEETQVVKRDATRQEEKTFAEKLVARRGKIAIVYIANASTFGVGSQNPIPVYLRANDVNVIKPLDSKAPDMPKIDIPAGDAEYPNRLVMRLLWDLTESKFSVTYVDFSGKAEDRRVDPERQEMKNYKIYTQVFPADKSGVQAFDEIIKNKIIAPLISNGMKSYKPI